MRRRSPLAATGFAFTTLALVLKVPLVACSPSDGAPASPSGVGATPDAGGDGAGPGADGPGSSGPTTIAPGPSRGSAIAVSADDSIVVVVNRDVGSVTVFAATYDASGAPPTLSEIDEIAVGEEPWQVAIAPSGDSAYVVVRKDQKLVKLTGLKTKPVVAASVPVGSEPTAVALTPGGTHAWVTSWVDGTVQGIETASMKVTSTIDLNTAIVATGLLGEGAVARPALAHPRSLAITNNGDANEDDESIYVTEYYAQRIAPEADNGANADVAKAGLVYKVKLSDKSVSTIRLAPLADIGFKDSAGAAAGCYPNQLQSITIQDHFAYVSSICASPKGPIGVVAGATPNTANVKTTTHGAVSVVDLSTDAEVTSATASLHAAFGAEFDKRAMADDGSRRYPGVPSDIAFVTGGGVGYVAANAADAIFRVRYDVAQASAIGELGTTSQPFIDLNPAGIPADKSGQNPIGIATPNQDAHKRFAFVANDISRNVSILDFNQQSVAGGSPADAVVERSSALPADASLEGQLRRGKRFFNTATGRWSLAGQGWNGCQACHMDGLSDNVTWYFARGPRQSTSLDGSFSKKDATDQRIFNWTSINDEVSDFEGNTRTISGGVGSIVSKKATPASPSDRIDPATGSAAFGLVGSIESIVDRGNPLGLAVPNVSGDWDDIKAYVQHVRSPRRPTNLDGAKVAAGQQAFSADGSCQGCHGGDKWTISKRFYTPSVNEQSTLTTTAWTVPTSFPSALLPAASQRFLRFSNGDVANFDQIQCSLRPVGTFGLADGVMGQVVERRGNMTATAQGNETEGKGYNVPSLLGVQVGAPFLHAGGAATLESLLGTTFAAHYQALAPNLLTEGDPAARAAKVAELVQFLLSIDEDMYPVDIPTPGAAGGVLCPP